MNQFERSWPEGFYTSLSKEVVTFSTKKKRFTVGGTCCHWPRSNLRSCNWPSSKSEEPQLPRSARHWTNSLSTFIVSCWWSNADCCREVHTEEERSSGCVTTLHREPNSYCGGCVSCYLDTWMACSRNCCHFHFKIQDMALSAVVWSWRLRVFWPISRLLHQKQH